MAYSFVRWSSRRTVCVEALIFSTRVRVGCSHFRYPTHILGHASGYESSDAYFRAIIVRVGRQPG
ncbi:hypothetical protein FGIG_12576 [Fasciola gigantica]|uniref:Uncharacterized protein n=1 Tax=Fasciola gigantica TaxID=46835 RepID=A0A504YBJ1_FASGI|nr:hypothetical protein FGIG_12576 [Fasciola gigantica]